MGKITRDCASRSETTKSNSVKDGIGVNNADTELSLFNLLHFL